MFDELNQMMMVEHGNQNQHDGNNHDAPNYQARIAEAELHL